MMQQKDVDQNESTELKTTTDTASGGGSSAFLSTI